VRTLIIERADLQTRAQRLGYLSVTFICWFLWLYLFVPLLSLIAWALGATLVYQVMLQNLEIAELLALLGNYGRGVAVLAGVYLLWAVSSWLRFRGVDRRETPPRATDAQLAASHYLSDDELSMLRNTRRTVVALDQLERMFGHPPPRRSDLPIANPRSRAAITSPDHEPERKSQARR